MSWQEARKGFGAVIVTIITSILLIVLGIAYFGVTLWIMKIASEMFFGSVPAVNWAVLSASILAASAIIAGAVEKKTVTGAK